MISKSKKNYDFLSKYSIEYSLILILPIAAIFSIFLLEVILLCIVLSFLLRNYFKFEKKYFFNKFSFYFALFFTYLFLRFIFNDTYSHENYLFVIFYFRYGLYVLSIFYFLNKLSNLHDNFIKVIILCIIILFLDGIVQYLLGSNILGYKLVSGNRVTSFFNSESILGSYLIKILPFVYIFFLSKTSSKKNFLFLLIVIMCVYLTFISGERASFALILLMTFYFIVINRKIYFSKISLFFSFRKYT